MFFEAFILLSLVGFNAIKAQDDLIISSESQVFLTISATNNSVAIEDDKDFYVNGVLMQDVIDVVQVDSVPITGNPFIFEIEASANLNLYELPLCATGRYHFRVDWGDGSPTEVINSLMLDSFSHTYDRGTYQISLDGIVNGLCSKNLGVVWKPSITDIKQWGCVSNGGIRSNFRLEGEDLTHISALDTPTLIDYADGVFTSCKELRSIATPFDLSKVVEASGLFEGCEKLEVNSLRDWDVSNLRVMDRMFYNPNLDAPRRIFNIFSSWDTSNVLSAREMFAGRVIDADLSRLDFSSLEDASGMFYYSTFNVDDTINGWNVASLRIADKMFFAADIKNQSISSWDVSSLVSAVSMFEEATCNGEDLTTWNVQSLKYADRFLRVSYRTQNLDLSSWNTESLVSADNMFFFSNNPGDLGAWNTSSLLYANEMMTVTSTYSEDLSSWDVDQVLECRDFSYNMPQEFKPDFSTSICEE